MKVDILSKAIKAEKPFPKLMITREGKVVLFSVPKIGTVINPLELHNEGIGGYCYSWAMEDFTDFEGSITLSND